VRVRRPARPSHALRVFTGTAALLLAATVGGAAAPRAAGSASVEQDSRGPAVAQAAGAAAASPTAAPRPQRVITLAPHLTELVYAAGGGDRLVGTIDTSDHPAAARRVPRIGDVARLDPERLLAARPDLVIAWGDGTPKEQLAVLRRLRLPVLEMQQHRLADVPDSVERLGRLFGTEAVARAEATRLRAELDRLRARYAGRPRVRVFYQVWSAPLYTLGGSHVVTEMLGVCGADNVFAAERTSGFAVDEESVYARDPDVLVMAGSAVEVRDWRARWAARPRLRALETGAVVVADPDLVNRMGPRLVAGTAQLCEGLDRVRANRAAGSAAGR